MTGLRFAEALRNEVARRPKMGDARVSLATGADIPALDRLNADIIARMPTSGLFMRQEHEFFEGVLGAGGAVLMLRSEGALVAYSVGLPVSAVFPAFLESAGADGLLHGTAVDARWRGRNWQTYLIELRCRALFASGCHAIQATAAPDNHRSLAHLTDTAFEVIALVNMPYGFPRFVLERRRLEPEPRRSAAGLERELLPPEGRLKAHTMRFSRGERAVLAERSPKPALYYRRDAKGGVE